MCYCRLCWVQKKLPYLTDPNSIFDDFWWFISGWTPHPPAISGLPDFLLAPQPQLGPTGAAQYLPGERSSLLGKRQGSMGTPAHFTAFYNEKTSMNPMFHGKNWQIKVFLGHNKVKRHLSVQWENQQFSPGKRVTPSIKNEHWRTPPLCNVRLVKPLVVSESGRSSETEGWFPCGFLAAFQPETPPRLHLKGSTRKEWPVPHVHIT